MDRDLAPLPAPMVSIIGRETEIERARLLIEQQRVRLVTLTGAAGVGKTRLAVAVAAACASDFAHRVSFIGLAALTDTAMLLRHLASTLGVADSIDPIAGLRQHLRSGRRLLVLDNLEQLPGAGLELSRLLQGVETLTILATSRTPLMVYGEYVFPVEPFPLPTPDADMAQIEANPAIRLLVDSAVSVNAGFDLPPSDLPVLVEIARRVDALPLALELAGAYIPLLGAQGVRDRLEHALSVLVADLHDLPARLRTMRDAIAWSYELLTPLEQAFFRRLSIFTGGFTFEMAEAMVRSWHREDGYPYLFGMVMPTDWVRIGKEASDLERSDWQPEELTPLDIPPLAALDSLVMQNLIRPVRSESGIERFELLETIREFGLEQLARAGEVDAARHAHAVLMTQIAEVCGVASWGAEWRPAVAWIEAELPNIRSAIAWLATQPEEANQLRMRLVEALWPFWQSRGFATEGCQHLENALARPGGTDGARSAAWNLLGALRWIRGDLDGASTALDEALPILQRIEFSTGLGRNFLFRSLVAWSQRDFDRSEKMARIASKHFTDGNDLIGIPLSSLILGVAARARGDLEDAAMHFAVAYGGFLPDAEVPFAWGGGVTRYYMAEMARERGDRVRAVTHLRGALATLLDIGDPWTVSGCVGTLATYLVEDGELDEAARLLGAAHGLASGAGVFLPPTETATHARVASQVQERVGPDAFSQLFAEGEQWSMEEAAAHAMAVPMESPEERRHREAGREPNPLRLVLTEPQLRTLELLRDDLSIKEIALLEGRKPTSIYERVDRIKDALGLPRETSILGLLRFVESNEIL